MSLLWRRDQK